MTRWPRTAFVGGLGFAVCACDPSFAELFCPGDTDCGAGGRTPETAGGGAGGMGGLDATGGSGGKTPSSNGGGSVSGGGGTSCVGDEQCTDPLLPYCHDGACVECRGNEHCKGMLKCKDNTCAP